MAYKRILLRRDTASNWTSNNPTLSAGEFGYESNTGKYKIGNGSTAWTSLAYSIVTNLNAATLNDLGDVTITSAADGDFLRWNGTAWINDAVNLSTDTVGSYVTSLVAGTAITLSNNSGEGATPTVAVTANTFDAYGAASTAAGNAATALTNHEADTTSIHGIADTSILVTTTGTQTLTNKTITSPSGLVKGDVGLGNVDNTSNATERAASATLTNKTLTSPVVNTPTGIVKGDVGLGSVDNTADTAKPVSTAGQTALNLKANLASPTFTGTVTLPNDTVALGTKTTGDYVSSLVAGTGVTLSNNSGETATPTIAIGQAVATNSNVTFNDLIVSGNLTVSGTTTSINTETLTVDDNIIVLNNNATGAPTQDAGLEVERGSAANVALRWNETSDKWELTANGSTYADIATETYAAAQTPQTLDAIGDVTITSASSGQFLKWNGTAWVNDAIPVINNIDDITGVTITAAADKDFLMYNGTAWVDSPITLGTDTTGGYVATLTAGTGITLANNSGEGASPTVTVDTSVIQARVTNVTDTEIGYLDGVTSGVQGQIDLKAPLASPTFTGTPLSTTASAGTNTTQIATTAFVIDAVTSATAANTVELGVDTTGSYVASLVAGTGVTLANNSGETATPTVTVDTTVIAALASPTFTGTPTLPTGTIATTQSAADSTTKVATTAFVTTADNLKANLASPTFTGTPTLPTGTIATTQSAGNNTTAVATTAFVTTAVAAVSIDFSSDQNILANAVFG